MMEAIRVVTLASKMVPKARLYPVSIEPLTDLPLDSSSRIRSRISTLASMAMPMVSTTPAMPGRVRVASREQSTPSRKTRLRSRAKLAIIPASR